MPPKLEYWNGFLKLRFSRLSMREKTLALLFIIGIAGIWFTFQMERHSTVWSSITTAHNTARNQRIWLDNSEDTKAQFEALISDINLETLPKRDEVNATIDSMVRKYGFTEFGISPPRTDVGIPLSFHSFTLDLKKASFEQVFDFTDEIKETLSYVGLREITIQAPRRTPHLLDAKINLKSIEYTP